MKVLGYTLLTKDIVVKTTDYYYPITGKYAYHVTRAIEDKAISGFLIFHPNLLKTKLGRQIMIERIEKWL